MPRPLSWVPPPFRLACFLGLGISAFGVELVEKVKDPAQLSGRWTDPTTWQGGAPIPDNVPSDPNTVYAARITSGTVELDADITIASVTIDTSGGLITSVANPGRKLTVQGKGSAWRAGSLLGTNGVGELVIRSTGDLSTPDLSISGSTPKSLGNWVLRNSGSVRWDGGNISSGSAAAIVNNSGALFTTTFDGTLAYDLGGAQTTFTNAGTFRKTAGNAGSRTTIQTAFTNSGLVDVQAGTLQFEGSVTSNGGTFVAQSGGTLVFAGGQQFNDGSSLTGPGLIQAIDGATTVSGTITLGVFELAGGSLMGSAIIASGVLRWTGGGLRDAATLTLNPGAQLEILGPGNRDFGRGDGNSSGGRVIDNYGRIIWANAGDLRGGDGAQIINRPGAIFEVKNDRSFGHNGNGDPTTFTNSGTLLKSAGTGTTSVPARFNQDATGTIAVLSGTIVFTSSFTNQNGSFLLANGTGLAFSSPLQIGTGTLAGAGTVTAPAVIAGGMVAPRASPGTMTITGDLTLLSTSTLLLELGGLLQGTHYDFLKVGGAAQLAGTLAVSLVDGFVPAAANTFTVLTAHGLAGLFSNVANGRILTTDGLGSFQVNAGGNSAFGANNLVLSNFVAVPEPSTWALLGTGVLLMAFKLYRRRR